MNTSAAVEVEHDSKGHYIWDITSSTWFCSRKRQQNKSAPRFASSLLPFSIQGSLILNVFVLYVRVACGPVAFVAIIANRSRRCWLPANNILTLPNLILNDRHPGRMKDLEHQFGRDYTQLSRLFNETIGMVWNEHENRMSDYLDFHAQRFDLCRRKIEEKGEQSQPALASLAYTLLSRPK